MSKTAKIFLLMSLVSFLAAMALPPESADTSALLGCSSALFLVLLVLALMRGRKIRFDPMLR
ncbi:hypothetical protein GUY40_12215 [Pseudomonas sp. R5(2019)]|nr:hypothetical protein [Pseudomonas sp. R5(2019)]